MSKYDRLSYVARILENDNDISLKEAENLICSIRDIIFDNSSPYYTKNIIKYISKNDISKELVYDIFDDYDFEPYGTMHYYSRKNSNKILTKIYSFKVIIKYYGIDYLLDKIFNHKYLDNYIMLLYMSIDGNKDKTTNLLLNRLSTHNDKHSEYLLTIDHREINGSKLPYYIIGCILRIRDSFNYVSYDFKKKIRPLLSSHDFFTIFTSKRYFDLYNRIHIDESILEYEKAMNTKFTVVELGTLIIKNFRSVDVGTAKEEFINRLCSCDNIEQQIDWLVNKINDSFSGIHNLYKILNKRKLITHEIVNNIFHEIEVFSGFYNNVELQRSFIDNGLTYETIISCIDNNGGTRYYHKRGSVIGVGEQITAFLKRYKTHNRLQKIKKIRANI